MQRLMYRNRAELEHLVVTNHQQGWSIRRLTKTLHVSRNTVRAILRKHHKQREQGHSAVGEPSQRAPRPTKLDQYVDFIKAELVEYSDIVGQRMFEKLKDKGYTGGITQVRARLNKLRAKPARKPHMRFETDPAEQGQFDWSPFRVRRTTGGKFDVLCFSYILGYSRRQFIDFTERRDFYTLIRRHVDAFEYFKGVPKTCLYDGEKTVILRWEAGHPIFNPAFLSFITHYNCRPIACGPRRPELKGKVEQPFKYVLSSLLNARKFSDLDDLRRMARWWMQNKSDLHKHDTTGRPPIELFLEREQAELQSLPREPYDTARVVFHVCDEAGFVHWQTNAYSVPLNHIGDILAIRITEHKVVVYDPELNTIATHERKPDGARDKAELPEHRRDRRIRYGIAPVRETFENLGPKATEFLEGLAKRHPRYAGFHARRILVLREHYHSADIHKALRHAVRFQAFDASAIERILRARFRTRTLEETEQHHAREKLRTMPRITQRPLSAYERYLNPTSTSPSTDELDEPDDTSNDDTDHQEDPDGESS